MNKFFICLVGLAFCATLFTLGKTTLGCIKYFSLSRQETAYIDSWQVQEIDSASFAVQISYHFFVNGQEIAGKTELAKPFFPSHKSAEAAIKTLQQKPWKAFYSPKYVKKNSLQKAFPFRDCIHALLSLGVLIYFFILKKWVQKLAI